MRNGDSNSALLDYKSRHWPLLNDVNYIKNTIFFLIYLCCNFNKDVFWLDASKSMNLFLKLFLVPASYFCLFKFFFYFQNVTRLNFSVKKMLSHRWEMVSLSHLLLVGNDFFSYLLIVWKKVFCSLFWFNHWLYIMAFVIFCRILNKDLVGAISNGKLSFSQQGFVMQVFGCISFVAYLITTLPYLWFSNVYEGIHVSPYSMRKTLENTSVPIADLPKDKFSTRQGGLSKFKS
jgi:hypothetical protein